MTFLWLIPKHNVLGFFLHKFWKQTVSSFFVTPLFEQANTPQLLPSLQSFETHFNFWVQRIPKYYVHQKLLRSVVISWRPNRFWSASKFVKKRSPEKFGLIDLFFIIKQLFIWKFWTVSQSWWKQPRVLYSEFVVVLNRGRSTLHSAVQPNSKLAISLHPYFFQPNNLPDKFIWLTRALFFWPTNFLWTGFWKAAISKHPALSFY